MGGPREAYEVMEYIRSGLLKPTVTEISLEDVPAYMEKVSKSGCFGKIIVRVGGIHAT